MGHEQRREGIGGREAERENLPVLGENHQLFLSPPSACAKKNGFPKKIKNNFWTICLWVLGERGKKEEIPQRENDIEVSRLEIREPSFFTLFNLPDRRYVLPRSRLIRRRLPPRLILDILDLGDRRFVIGAVHGFRGRKRDERE